MYCFVSGVVISHTLEITSRYYSTFISPVGTVTNQTLETHYAISQRNLSILDHWATCGCRISCRRQASRVANSLQNGSSRRTSTPRSRCSPMNGARHSTACCARNSSPSGWKRARHKLDSWRKKPAVSRHASALSKPRRCSRFTWNQATTWMNTTIQKIGQVLRWEDRRPGDPWPGRSAGGSRGGAQTSLLPRTLPTFWRPARPGAESTPEFNAACKPLDHKQNRDSV